MKTSKAFLCPVMSSTSSIHASSSLKSSTSTVLSRSLIQRCRRISTLNPLMTVGLVPLLRHQLLLLISIFPLLPKVKVKEIISRKKNPQKLNEIKDNVKNDIRGIFGGSTIVKLGGSVNSKEKKIVKVD